MKKKNTAYQEVWEKYIKANKKDPYVMLPLEVGMTNDGEFYRSRMGASDVAKIRDGIIDLFPKYVRAYPLEFGVPKQIFGNYIKFFDRHDSADLKPVNTPFDLTVTHPTWILFSLGNANWKFSKKGPQFSTENDDDGFLRNYVQVGMFDDPRLPKKKLHGQPMNSRKLLILANRNRSAPTNLKYNLHVDILQTLNRKRQSTEIMIDPGGNNSPTPPFGDLGD